jgi:pyruvate/2-oxoglutarate dehydrogenase complex dihydrolipoamide dehydrogenase (E3) component
MLADTERTQVTGSQQYDAVVIGSGQGGTPLCKALANGGLRTAIIEREHVGGTCINEGCTPTKTMVASARVTYLARRAADYGVETGSLRIHLERVRQRKRDIVDSFRNSGQSGLENTENLDLIFGEASFTGPKSLLIRMKDGSQRNISAEKIFINAGCRPGIPPIDGINEVAYLTSTSIMELAEVPEHLLVLGGGYVGLEFGQMFRRFGSRVSIVQSGPQLLTKEDPDVAETVASILREDGVEVFLNARAERVTKSGSQIMLSVKGQGTSQTLSGSHLLVAVGRPPNTETLNLPAAGVATNKAGFIPVNSKLETNVPGVYALGDINGGPAFTHISYDDFRILAENILHNGSAITEGRFVPYTVFIDPQLGRVGLTESDARAQNKKFRVAKMPMSRVARALEIAEPRGFMKAIVDPQNDQILGAAILGIEGGELMSMLEIAMMGKVPYTKLRDGIFAHPTLAESFNNLFSSFTD